MEPSPPPHDQPFSCGQCNLSFSNGRTLAEHMKSKHTHNLKLTSDDIKWLKAIRIKWED